VEILRGYVEGVDQRVTDDMRDSYRYIEESKRDLYERIELASRDNDESISDLYRRMDSMADDCCAGSKK